MNIPTQGQYLLYKFKSTHSISAQTKRGIRMIPAQKLSGPHLERNYFNQIGCRGRRGDLRVEIDDNDKNSDVINHK